MTSVSSDAIGKQVLKEKLLQPAQVTHTQLGTEPKQP
jgi:hypothetical protein